MIHISAGIALHRAGWPFVLKTALQNALNCAGNPEVLSRMSEQMTERPPAN